MQNDKMNSRWANGLNVLAGIWLIISPFILGLVSGSVMTNDIWVGIVVGIFALIRFFSTNRASSWLSWVNLVLGAWLIVSPLVILYVNPGQVTNSIILGIIVMILSGWSISSTRNIEEITGKEKTPLKAS